MPELIRLALCDELAGESEMTPRERRLYMALAVILTVNTLVISGLLTFVHLLLRPL